MTCIRIQSGLATSRAIKELVEGINQGLPAPDIA